MAFFLQAFIAELTHQSFAVVACPLSLAAAVQAVFAAPDALLGQSGAAGPLVWSFKRQGDLKDGRVTKIRGEQKLQVISNRVLNMSLTWVKPETWDSWRLQQFADRRGVRSEE